MSYKAIQETKQIVKIKGKEYQFYLSNASFFWLAGKYDGVQNAITAFFNQDEAKKLSIKYFDMVIDFLFAGLIDYQLEYETFKKQVPFLTINKYAGMISKAIIDSLNTEDEDGSETVEATEDEKKNQ